MKKITFIVAFLSFTISTISLAQSVVAKREFNNTLKTYFEAKNALAKDNAALASTSVLALIKNIEEFPVKTLSTDQQELWKKESVEVKKASLAITTENGIKEQRKHFFPLSNAMIKMTKAFNMNSATIFVQYCPMAKRSWLNEVEAVQNPFYGSMMYDCGEVTETIAKK